MLNYLIKSKKVYMLAHDFLNQYSAIASAKFISPTKGGQIWLRRMEYPAIIPIKSGCKFD